MKTLIISILFAGITISSCRAQKQIAVLENNNLVKGINIKYKIEKFSKMTSIGNINNKLINVKQSSPNLPANINLFYYKKFDLTKIQEICAGIIPKKQVQEAINAKKNSSLFIRIKSDLKGVPLEMEFLTDNNSTLTINQIEQIEIAIRQSITIKIDSKADQFLQGTNFIVTDLTIWFRELIKFQK